MKTKRTLWRAIGASAIIALIGFGVGGCDNGSSTTLVTHTVTFNTHGGGNVPSQTVEEGQRATRPATNPTRAGYVFENWFTAATGGTAFNFDTPITGPTTIHAQWTAQAAENFTVSFDAAGGSPEPGDQTVAANGFATAPSPAPTKTGYTLDGWFAPGATAAFDFVATAITANITLTAQWTAQVAGYYTVIFDAAGGSPTPDNQTVAANGFATAPSPAPTRTGYAFDGWFAPSATAAFAFATTPITANITLSAQWTAQVPGQHTVTFNTHGGSPVDAQTVQDGQPATRPAANPTLAGYIFENWFTEATGGTAFDTTNA